MRNVKRLTIHGELCKRLGQLSHPATGSPLFRTFRELSCFAAMLGYEQGRRRVLDGPTELLVDGRIFEGSETALDVAYLLGLAESVDPDVLADNSESSEKLALIFEELTAGGLDILGEWLEAEPSDPNGDRAVLTALNNGGYLDRAEAAGDAIENVVF